MAAGAFCGRNRFPDRGSGNAFIGGKNFIKRDKEKRAMEEAAMAEEKAAEPEKTIEKKTMSIAERARLASSLEESERRRQNREAGRVRNG